MKYPKNAFIQICIVCMYMHLAFCSCTKKTQLVETDNFFVEIPGNWKSVINENLSVMGSMVTLINKNFIGQEEEALVIICLNQDLSPEYMIEQQVVAGVNEFFRHAETGEITEYRLGNVSGKQIFYTKSVSGVLYKGKAYALNTDGTVYFIFYSCKNGKVPKSEDVLKSLTFKESQPEKTKSDNMSEIRTYITILKKLLPCTVDDYTMFSDIAISTAEDEIIYTYTIDLIKMSAIISPEVVADIVPTLKANVLRGLIEESSSLPLIEKCMKENMKFTYVYFDSEKNLLGSFTFGPDEYKISRRKDGFVVVEPLKNVGLLYSGQPDIAVAGKRNGFLI